MHLTVIHPFGDYQRGDCITDAAEIEDVVKGKPKTDADGKPLDERHDGFGHHCVRVKPAEDKPKAAAPEALPAA